MHVSTGGDIAPCCEFDGNVGNVSSNALAEVWKSKEWMEIRRKFASGERVDGCWKCYDREDNEGSSVRLDANRRHADWLNRFSKADDLVSAAPEYPVTYDLRPSNLCNLSCRTCWHGASSSWFKDGLAMGVTAGPTAEIRSYKNGQEILNDIGPALDAVEEMYFAGGEPLMMEEHYSLLSELAAIGRSDISLKYNTNLTRTTFRGQSIFDLWAQFDNVEVDVSVDAAYEKGDLIRNGFNWQRFVDNVSKLRTNCPNVRINFGITVSALNVLYLAELFDALIAHCGARPGDFVTHSLQSPALYRTQVLPRELKAKARNRLENWVKDNVSKYPRARDGFADLKSDIENICNYMDGSDLRQHIPELASLVRRLDKLRNQDTETTLPDLSPVLNKSVIGSIADYVRLRASSIRFKRA